MTYRCNYTSAFKKVVFYLKGSKRHILLVHCIDDQTIIQPPVKHGNCKSRSKIPKAYNTTSKDVLKLIDFLKLIDDIAKTNASNIHCNDQVRKECMNDPNFQCINSQVPRNVHQIKNRRYKAKLKLKVFNDEISNVHHLICNGLDCFVKYVATHPTIDLYICDDKVLELANRLLQTKTTIRHLS